MQRNPAQEVDDALRGLPLHDRKAALPSGLNQRDHYLRLPLKFRKIKTAMNWLLSDLVVLGWHIQPWPLIIPLGAMAASLFTELAIPE
jgi:hypothetical protein